MRLRGERSPTHLLCANESTGKNIIMTIASITARMPIEMHFVLNIVHLQLRRDVINPMPIITADISQSACGIVIVAFQCTYRHITMVEIVTATALSERLDQVRGKIEA